MATTIDSLPSELLSKVLSLLPGYEIPNIGRTCKYIHQATHIGLIWQTRCEKEYHIPKFHAAPLGSYYKLYSKVLHPYGFMLGVWKADLGHYGGLLSAECTAEGAIVLWEHHGVGRVTDPLYCVQLCKVFFCEDRKETRLQCGMLSPHGCCVKKISSREMIFQCQDINKDTKFKHTADLTATYQHLKKSYPPDVHHSTLLLQRASNVERLYQDDIKLSRLDLPSPMARVPILPGLFTGTYGLHGIEILMLTYPDGNSTADILKITGDPNVPAGKVSIQADLKRAMILTAEQQESLSMLHEIDTSDLPPSTDMSRLPSQPFVMPFDLYEREDLKPLPKQCSARFHSKSLIAGANHTNPQHIRGHWIVFDEDTFGHIWFELNSMSLFKRVRSFLPASK